MCVCVCVCMYVCVCVCVCVGVCGMSLPNALYNALIMTSWATLGMCIIECGQDLTWLHNCID